MLTFAIAGIIAFSTGTSYGTMSILIPIILPLSYRLSMEAGLEPQFADQIGYAALAATLGGAVFGDHCSPISDTTVISSMASGADHIDHVKTQLPYAIMVAILGLVCYFLVGMGVPAVLNLALGVIGLGVAFFTLSRKVTDPVG